MARRYRFFIEGLGASDLEKDVSLTSEAQPELVSQLGKVLRVRPGDVVVLLPMEPAGYDFVFSVEVAHKKGVDLHFVEKVKNDNELPSMLGLVLCLPNKPDKLSMMVQKAVELGVGKIILVEGDFSQMKHRLREDRLTSIIREAAEQSERFIVPKLEVANEKLRDFLVDTERADVVKHLLVAMERSEGEDGRLSELVARMDEAWILVGPEGGFSDEEKAAISELKLATFSLGKRVLRMETAAIVALGIASQNWTN